MNYFITAIGTDSGKTLTAAIFAEALQADYWKPVQAGEPTDASWVRKHVRPDLTIHPETYLLDMPASPHAAAKAEGLAISLERFKLPSTSRPLIIEGAGGIMVPLNDKYLVIDIARKLRCEVILVCDLYLGSINHSLLSLEYLQSHNIPLKGIVFNGEPNQASQDIILKRSGVPCLLHIHREPSMSRDIILKYAAELKSNLL